MPYRTHVPSPMTVRYKTINQYVLKYASAKGMKIVEILTSNVMAANACRVNLEYLNNVHTVHQVCPVTR